MLTGEQIRFHAAGHLAAAAALVERGHAEAAKHVLRIVREFAASPRVQGPPQIAEKLEQAILAPAHCLADIVLLEQWFVHPANAVMEARGAHG